MPIVYTILIYQVNIHYYANLKNKNGGASVRSIAVACWTIYHYHPCSNLDVDISEGCFIFDFASLPPTYHVHKIRRETPIIIIIIVVLKNEMKPQNI